MTEQYGDGDSEDDHAPDATLTVERADTGGERLLAEQLMGDGMFFGFGSPYGALRNGVAPFGEGVETVVVRTDESAVDQAVGYDGSERRFSFRGQAYVATAERSGD
jgi:hypothetical protein